MAEEKDNKPEEKEEDIVHKYKVDTSEAVRNLKSLEQQVNKLGDMADQGERMQNGILSPKQVSLYRKILSEMEKARADNLEKLKGMEEKYTETTNREEFKRLKEFEDNVKKRTELLKAAQGGNKWGDVSSPAVQEFHKFKLEEAKENLESYEKSDEYKDATKIVGNLESEIAKMSKVVSEMNAQVERGSQHSSRIDELRVRDPNIDKVMSSLSTLASATGIITGVGAYMGYTNSGIDTLREQEKSAYGVSQKLSGDMSDDDFRDNSKATGENNAYGLNETLSLQNLLATGGITNTEDLNKDTDSVQKFSRAYAVNPSGMAESGTLLRKMGSLEEGQMDRFARLIGGQVARNNNLGGREEEVQRATMALAQSVSKGMDRLSNDGLNNIVGLQSDVGEVRGLEGERGAATLANMDSAIKNGSSDFDLLMGKGTEFVGVEGMIELGYQKEKGISDPKNVERILKNSERLFGDTEMGSKITEAALAENGFLSQHEYRALDEAGILDKWKAGDFNTQDEVEALGDADLTAKTAQWDDTQTSQFLDNQAQNENLKASHAKAAEETSTTANSLWHKIPEPLQNAILPSAAIGGMFLGRSIIKGAGKYMFPKVGGTTGGPMDKVKDVLTGGKGFAGAAKKFAGPLGTLGTIAAGEGIMTGGMDSVLGYEEGDIKREGLLFRNPFKGLERHTESKDSILKDRDVRDKPDPVPDSEDVSTKSKETDDFIRTSYENFGGDADPETAKALTKDSAMQNLGLSSESADEAIENLFNKKSPTEMFKETTSDFSTSNLFKEEGKNPEQVVRIVLEGEIKGMDKDNQETVAKSITSYFERTLAIGSNNSFTYDLSRDQTRT